MKTKVVDTRTTFNRLHHSIESTVSSLPYRVYRIAHPSWARDHLLRRLLFAFDPLADGGIRICRTLLRVDVFDKVT